MLTRGMNASMHTKKLTKKWVRLILLATGATVFIFIVWAIYVIFFAVVDFGPIYEIIDRLIEMTKSYKELQGS